MLSFYGGMKVIWDLATASLLSLVPCFYMSLIYLLANSDFELAFSFICAADNSFG